MNKLLELWINYIARLKWEKTRAEAEANNDTTGVQAADQMLAGLPEISVLEALRANANLVSILSVQRFIAMKTAREQGISLEQIGNALGVSRQSAWEFFQRKQAGQKLSPGSDAKGTLE